MNERQVKNLRNQRIRGGHAAGRKRSAAGKRQSGAERFLRRTLSLLVAAAMIAVLIVPAMAAQDAVTVVSFEETMDITAPLGTAKKDLALPEQLAAVISLDGLEVKEESGASVVRIGRKTYEVSLADDGLTGTILIPVKWEDGGLYDADKAGEYFFTAVIDSKYQYADTRPTVKVIVDADAAGTDSDAGAGTNTDSTSSEVVTLTAVLPNGVTLYLTAPVSSLPYPQEELTLSAELLEDPEAVKLVEEEAPEAASGTWRETMLFDIRILHNGAEIEPEGPVHVTFTGLYMPNDDAQIFHVAEKNELEEIEATSIDAATGGFFGEATTVESGTAANAEAAYVLPVSEEIIIAPEGAAPISMTTDHFSVYALTYTNYLVDYYYNDAEHHQGGGTSMMLSELFLYLGIFDRYVADVTDVVFSDPSLISVEKVQREQPVQNEDPQSAQNEDAQSAQNDAAQAESDWCLTSLLPFDTEETLTITFADGSTIVIRVEDAPSLGANTANKVVVTGNVNNFSAQMPSASYRIIPSKLNLARPIGSELFLYGIRGYNGGANAAANANSPMRFARGSLLENGNLYTGYRIYFDNGGVLRSDQESTIFGEFRIRFKDAAIDQYNKYHDVNLTFTGVSLFCDAVGQAEGLQRICLVAQDGSIGATFYGRNWEPVGGDNRHVGVHCSFRVTIDGATASDSYVYGVRNIDVGGPAGYGSTYDSRILIHNGALSKAYLPSTNWLVVKNMLSNTGATADGLAFSGSRDDPNNTWNSGFATLQRADSGSWYHYWTNWCRFPLMEDSKYTRILPRYRLVNANTNTASGTLASYQVGDKGGTVALYDVSANATYTWTTAAGTNFLARYNLPGKSYQIRGLGAKAGFDFVNLQQNTGSGYSVIQSTTANKAFTANSYNDWQAYYTPKLGTVTIKKKVNTTSGANLAGAVFELTGSSNYASPVNNSYTNNVKLRGTTDANGNLVFRNVPISNGSYTVKEVTPPSGYYAAPNQTVAVTASNLNPSLTFVDAQRFWFQSRPAYRTINANTGTNSGTLSGWVAGEKGGTVKFVANGTTYNWNPPNIDAGNQEKYRREYFPWNTKIRVTSVDPTAGYYRSGLTDEYRQNITPNTDITLNRNNTARAWYIPVYGSITVKKTDEHTGAAVQGAVFTLKGTSESQGAVNLKGTTNAQGIITFDYVPTSNAAGYTLREETAPGNYLPASDIKLYVQRKSTTANGIEVYQQSGTNGISVTLLANNTVNVKDTPRYYVQIAARRVTLNANTGVASGTFGSSSPWDTKGGTISMQDTTASSQKITYDNTAYRHTPNNEIWNRTLYPYNHTIRLADMTPKQGYYIRSLYLRDASHELWNEYVSLLNNATTYSFKLEKSSVAQIVYAPITGKVTVTKVDDETGEPMSGITFRLEGTSPVTDDGIVNLSATTNDQGIATFTNVPYSTNLKLVEVNPPENYHKAADVPVSITQKDQVVEVTVRNKPKEATAKFRIKKSDPVSNVYLKDANFELEDDETGDKYSFTTLADGTVMTEIVGTAAGKTYTLREVAPAPGGYILSGGEWTITAKRIAGTLKAEITNFAPKGTVTDTWDYTVDTTDPDEPVYIFTLANSREKHVITIIKEWDDQVEPDLRPETITAYATNGTTTFTTGVDTNLLTDNTEWLKNGSTWMYRFEAPWNQAEGFSVYEDAVDYYEGDHVGEANKVSVVKGDFDAATGTRNYSATITNTLSLRERIVITKVWDDNSNAGDTRPDDITAVLKKTDGSAYFETGIAVNKEDDSLNWTKNAASNSWTYTIEVPLNTGEVLYAYEIPVPGYSCTAAGEENKVSLTGPFMDAATKTRTYRVTITNRLNATVLITKEAAYSGDPLTGAEFTLTGSYNGQDISLVSRPVNETDEPGKYIIEDVPLGGPYTVTETLAPVGYAIAPPQTIDSITQAGAEIRLTFEDEPLTALVNVKKEIFNYEIYGDELSEQAFMISLSGGVDAEMALKHSETSKNIVVPIKNEPVSIDVSEIVPYAYEKDYEVVTFVTHVDGSDDTYLTNTVTLAAGDTMQITVYNTYIPTPFFKARTDVKNVFKAASDMTEQH